MFFLSLDITMHLGDHRFTDGKCAVPFLPCEGSTFLKRSRNPAGRVRFNLADQFRKCLVLAQLSQDMDVVGGSVNYQRNSIFSANCAAQVLMDSWTDGLSEPGFTAFRRKDDVIKQIAIGGTHGDRTFHRPFSGALSLLHITRSYAALHSGLYSIAPFGRSKAYLQYRNDRGVGSVLAAQRRRRGGLEPRVQRSETPGFHRIQECRTPARGDGPDESRRTCAHLEQPK